MSFNRPILWGGIFGLAFGGQAAGAETSALKFNLDCAGIRYSQTRFEQAPRKDNVRWVFSVDLRGRFERS